MGHTNPGQLQLRCAAQVAEVRQVKEEEQVLLARMAKGMTETYQELCQMRGPVTSGGLTLAVEEAAHSDDDITLQARALCWQPAQPHCRCYCANIACLQYPPLHGCAVTSACPGWRMHKGDSATAKQAGVTRRQLDVMLLEAEVDNIQGLPPAPSGFPLPTAWSELHSFELRRVETMCTAHLHACRELQAELKMLQVTPACMLVKRRTPEWACRKVQANFIARLICSALCECDIACCDNPLLLTS